MSIGNIFKTRVVKSFVTFFILLFIVAIIVYLKSFGVDISGWLEKWQKLSKFQSIFQLGAGVSLSFAVAGPKITDFISGIDEEIKKGRNTIILEGKKKGWRYNDRLELIDRLIIFFIFFKIRNEKLNKNMLLYYFSYAIACTLLLIISSFFDVEWQNQNILLATFVSVLSLFFSIWHTNSYAGKINRMSSLVRRFALSNPIDDPDYYNKGARCLKDFEQLYDILPPLREGRYFSYATDENT